MIVFYYTNAQTKDGEQKDPKKSLGGFVSSTPIPNGRSGNVFGDLGAVDLQNGGERIIAIAAKNISDNPLANLTIAVESPITPNVKYRFALVTVEEGVMEQINHFDAIPYVGDFMELGVDVQSGASQPVVASLGSGESIGVWLQRVISPSDSPDCEISTDTELNLDITFAWD